MPTPNTTIKHTCNRAHCTRNEDPFWKGAAAPTFSGRYIHDLASNLPEVHAGLSWNLEEKQFVWFYCVVHPILTQEMLALCMGRTHQALRLVILRLRKDAKEFVAQGVPLSSPQWDFIRPDRDVASSQPQTGLGASALASVNPPAAPLVGVEELTQSSAPVDPPALTFTPINPPTSTFTPINVPREEARPPPTPEMVTRRESEMPARQQQAEPRRDSARMTQDLLWHTYRNAIPDEDDHEGMLESWLNGAD